MSEKKGPNPPRVCIFCGGRPISGEHVISEWISGVIPRRNERHYQDRHEIVGNPKALALRPLLHRKRKEGDIASRKLHVACRRCNSEWMSNDVETPAMSALRPLLLGEVTVVSADMQRAIARWATLKCMVFEQDDKRYAAIPMSAIRRFKETKEPPDGFQVWAGYFAGSTWGTRFVHVGAELVGTRYNAQRVIGPESVKLQTTVFTIGKLFLRVASSSTGQITHRLGELERSVLHDLHPTGPDLVWPPPHTIGDVYAERMANSLNDQALGLIGPAFKAG